VTCILSGQVWNSLILLFMEINYFKYFFRICNKLTELIVNVRTYLYVGSKYKCRFLDLQFLRNSILQELTRN
jgi:hypothetical protein